MNISVLAKGNLRTRADHANRLNEKWHRTKESYFELGHMLIEARSELPHGEFSMMIESDLEFGPDLAQQLMRVAGSPRFANHETSKDLPSSPTALDALRRLPEDDFQAAVESGEIHRKMTVGDAKAIVGNRREPAHVEPRRRDRLKDPIIGETDLLATMKGYRAAQEISQFELNERSGMQGGYVNKLEVDIRRAINESWWDWMAGSKLVMLLVPAVDVRPGVCPCCGAKR